MRVLRLAIAGRRPRQRPALRDQITLAARLHHRAVGQFLQRHRQRMQPLLAAVQPLAVQHGVDVAREHVVDAIALLPRGAKPVGVVAAAEEARPMPGRERGGLVEKEQLGPASPAHHLAPAAAEFADAGEPRLARPAPRQRLGGGIVDDAAIAGEHAAMRGGDDVACRRDAVLQRHLSARSFSRSHCGMVEATQTPESPDANSHRIRCFAIAPQ